MPNIFQRAAGRIASAMGYRLGTGQALGVMQMNNPPEWKYQKYLESYGQIGWLYAVVSVRSNNIARNTWRLYRTNSQGDRDELDETDPKAGKLITLLKKPNPFQTRYQFFYQHQQYKDLVGEGFWQINFTTKGLPGEMWLMPPAFVNVIPSEDGYIDEYQYKRGKTDITFKPNEVIHIMHPDPFNPYRGISPAQALTLNLSIDYLSRKHQERVFYNNAIPALVVSYKPEDVPATPEGRRELEQSFNERFRGVMNAGKPFFAYGSDIKTITIDNHQLDMINLARMGRDDILGAYNTHAAIVGITENVNRANADAANYQFALQVVTPELTDIREAVNEKLCPFFDDYLDFDFDNPVAEDVAQQAAILDGHIKAGIISIEEARSELDQGDINPDDHFILAPGWQIIKGSDILDNATVSNTQSSIPPNDRPKSLTVGVKKTYSDSELNEIWKGYINSVEPYEKSLIAGLKEVFGVTEKDVLSQLKTGKKPTVDKTQIRTDYKTKASPILSKCMTEAYNNGVKFIAPENPHKAITKAPNAGLNWLNNRIEWAANEIGETLAQQLSDSMTQGLSAGESIPQLSDRVADIFGGTNGLDRNLRIARTETMMASNYGAGQGYKSMGAKYEKWLTAIDERTCQQCADMNGDVEPIDDFPMPPASTHPNCRCIGLPLRDEE